MWSRSDLFLGHTKKYFCKNCSWSCYSRCVWRMIRLMHGYQHLQHPKKLTLLDIDFLFWNIDSNKFPFIYSQISADHSLLLLNYLIKMSQHLFFRYTFSILCFTYLSISWFFFKIPCCESRRMFFHGHWEAIYFFFMVRKGIKSNHNNLFYFTDPFLSYIFINFCLP